ncbi:MAG: hypothetical protein AAFZ01_02000 [Pseudomonadota bacterium]
MIRSFVIGALGIGMAVAAASAHAAPALTQAGASLRTSGTAEAVPAQFNIQLGPSDQRIRRILRDRGYTEIEITKRSFTRVTAEACKDGVRYELRLTNRGSDRGTGRIGTCKQVITLAEAEKQLQDEGYRRINITEQGDIPYIAIACRDGERIRLRINKFGEVTGRRELGSCRKALTPDDVRAKLRDDGYNRIRFTDRQLPRYVAEACRNNRKFELTINRTGRVRNSKRIGRCAPPLTAATLEKSLIDRGLDRIEVIDSRPPRFVAEACRDQRRVELTIGRFGKILQEYGIGRCRPPLSRAQLLVVMRENGYRKVKFNTIPGTNYQTESCRKRKRMLTQWTQYGEVIDEKDRGPCVSPRLEQVTDRLADRGMKDLVMYVEGCRRGRKVRVTIDALTGDRLNRERIGRC